MDYFKDDDFDDAFFEEVDKLQLIATASTQPPPEQQSRHYSPVVVVDDALHTHSPPQELSLRNPTTTHSLSSTTSKSICSPLSDEQFEIERLKNELSSVSKELLDLKQECYELKKQRDRDKQLKIVYSSKKSSTCESEDRSRNGISPKRESVNATVDHAPSRIVIERKSTGIQTNKVDESLNPSTSGVTCTYGDLSELLSIWYPPLSGHGSRRKFVAELLEACGSDFCVLFGCLGTNMSSTMDNKSFTNASMPEKSLGQHSAEASKISELYSVLTELAEDMVHIKAFVAVLLDLCNTENLLSVVNFLVSPQIMEVRRNVVVLGFSFSVFLKVSCTSSMVLVVSKSLHILRIALEHVLSIDRTCSKRDNVKVESCNSGSDAVRIHDLEVENTCVHDVVWLDLFSSMIQIGAKLTDECARVEAVSILNIVLMRSHPHAREKFWGPHVFKAVALLLKEEAGVSCRKEAVHLLFLLLNCPSILATFCLSCEEADSHTQSPNKEGAITLASQESHAVLKGLADCVACSEHGVKELSLRRNAVIVLSFLASSGKSGFEVFVYHKLPEGANFLGLVLRVLVSEIDAEASESCPAPEIFKERTFLMREALILLNRLASHTAFSSTFFQALTSCRDTISPAIVIATRLSKRSSRLLISNSITRRMREDEVVDLACQFKKRVFTSLGETISL